MELLARAAGAGAQLLKAERVAPLAGDPAGAAGFLLTFDVGRILVSADPDRSRLALTAIPDRETAPSGLLDASEDEPWWRLLGSPLARATARADGAVLELRFGAAGDGQRRLVLELAGAGVHAALAHG